MRPYEVEERIQYIRNLFAEEDKLLKEVDADIRKEEFPIHISPEEAKLLQILIKLSGTTKVVEIGTHAGYSTIWLARSLPTNGKIYTLERTKSRAQMAKKNFLSLEKDTSEKIDLIEGDARLKLAMLEDKGPFDLVFIDADKISYLEYLEWAQKNVKKGGIIIGDNTMLFDCVYKDKPNEGISITAFKVMQEFNLRLADKDKYMSAMLPTSEGITIAIKLF